MTDLGNSGEIPRHVFLAVLKANGVKVQLLTGIEYLLMGGKHNRIWQGDILDPCHRRFVIAQAHRFGIETRMFYYPTEPAGGSEERSTST